MIKKYIIALFIGSTALQLEAQSVIDQSKSKIHFEISNMGVRTVEGVFTKMQGTIDFKQSDLQNSSFDVCIDASSINTENEKRDEHLKNQDFFYIDSFPNICFKSKSIVKDEEGYKVTGDLSMHGVTLELTFPFTYSYSSKYFKAFFELERLDYKIGEDYGSFTVGKTVEIEILCYLK